MKSQSSSNMANVKLLGQILEKSCEPSGGRIFGPIFMKLGQNDYFDEIL